MSAQIYAKHYNAMYLRAQGKKLYFQEQSEGQHSLEDLVNKAALDTVSEEQYQFSLDNMICCVWYFKEGVRGWVLGSPLSVWIAGRE